MTGLYSPKAMKQNDDLYAPEIIQQKASELLACANVKDIYPCPVELVVSYLGFSSHLFIKDKETENISGAVDHASKKIYVNANEAPQRRLFTAAHEIGHIVLHPSENRVDYRGTLITDPKEHEADLFAACLLMPEDEFRKQWRRFCGDINKISQFFGTSKSAVALRADRCNLT